jgi:prepilin-type N-terminal cleavage/methylation domain-containing protein
VSRVELLLVPRSGFTLLELMAALGLTGLVLLGAWRLLDQLGDARDRLTHQSAEHAAQINGGRLLRALVSRAESPVDSTQRFIGNVLDASFATWCNVPAGWLERCRVSLEITSSDDSSTVSISTEDAPPVRVWRGAGRSVLRYYGSAARDERWWDVWGTSIALPAAIGIVVDTDTLVLPVGAGR